MRATGFADAGNNNTNFRLIAVDALEMTYADNPWLTATVTAAGASGVTVSVPGKKLSVPSTGHTKDYFTIEDRHLDISHSTLIQDARVGTITIDIAPGAHATVSTQFLGRNATYPGAAHFASPTAEPTGALLAGPEGKLRYDGADSAVLTSLQITIGSNAEVKGVIGSNVSPDVFTSGVRVNGSLGALFDGGAVLENFDDEKEGPLFVYLFADSTPGSEFLVMKLPNAKINGADKSTDGTAITLSGNYSAGRQTTGTAVDLTTIAFIDSSVT